MKTRIGTVHDVILVGAGPVGLSLALSLARRGRDVLVLEKEPGTAERSRAPAIWPATQEILADLGMIEVFLDEGLVMDRLALHDADRGRILMSIPLHELEGETPYPHLLILPQNRTEAFLFDALQSEATQAGATAEVRFSSEVTGIEQDTSEVVVHLRHGEPESARFVVGCDGAHSVVRDEIGATLEGQTYPMRAALADVRLATGDADLHSPRLTTRPRFAVGIRMQRGIWRLILPFPGDGDVTPETRVRDAAESLFASRSWAPEWKSEFRLHRRTSSRFAAGRVVLAGDAAHLNSPVGGQGMNVGIEDAARLTEVLTEALDGDTREPLLVYAHERRQEIQQGVNRFTDTLTRILFFARGRLIRPTLRLVNLATKIPSVRRRITRRLAMLD